MGLKNDGVIKYKTLGMLGAIRLLQLCAKRAFLLSTQYKEVSFFSVQTLDQVTSVNAQWQGVSGGGEGQGAPQYIGIFFNKVPWRSVVVRGYLVLTLPIFSCRIPPCPMPIYHDV